MGLFDKRDLSVKLSTFNLEFNLEMYKRISESDHDQMVRDVYNHLISEGFSNVNATLEGLPQPDRIYWKSTGNGHIPDVTANNNGNHNLFEIETDDSIFDQHTEDQWKLFAAHARQHGKTFRVVVPKGSEASAQLRLTHLGIQVEVWTVG